MIEDKSIYAYAYIYNSCCPLVYHFHFILSLDMNTFCLALLYIEPSFKFVSDNNCINGANMKIIIILRVND